ncbi:MAG: AIM24 family protein [Azospirillaceae bacterium]
MRADAIDFRIGGAETQYVEIALDPGENAIAEAGALMYKDPGIAMTTIFGDGSGQDDGLVGRLIGAGRRVLTGEGLFSTVFTHEGQGKARVAFAAPYPGHILALRLTEAGGRLICQKDAFLAAAKGVEIGLHFQDRVLAGLFGGEGFVMQRLDGDGWVFVHIGGAVVERTLGPEDTLEVDTGCLAAMTATVGFDVVRAGGVKTMLFGGEGLFLARLSGPGRVWLQSLPISRLAGRLHALAPDHGGRRREEGSLLGGIGDLVGGDRRF